MIFVTVGTLSQPFPRLIDEVIDFYKTKKEQAVIQSGTYKLLNNNLGRNIKLIPFLEFNHLDQYLKHAETIICSGGEGTLIQILSHTRHKPIIFPRIKKYHEHVNDQQLLIGQAIKKIGLAHLVQNANELRQILTQPEKFSSTKPLSVFETKHSELINRLNQLSI